MKTGELIKIYSIMEEASKLVEEEREGALKYFEKRSQLPQVKTLLSF